MNPPKKKNLFLIVADHLLESDNLIKEWAEDAKLRRTWYWLCAFMVGFLAVTLIFRIPLRSFAGESETATLIYRWASFLLILAFIVITIIFTTQYARFVLSRKGVLHLPSIGFFYILSLIGFAKLHYFLYFLAPGFYTLTDPHVEWTPFFTDVAGGNYKLNFEFMLYSALNSMNAQYHRIAPSSAWVSLVTYIQSLYTLCLVAVLIAGYVNQKFEFRGDPPTED